MERVTHTFIPKSSNGIFILGEYAEMNDWNRGYHFSGGSGQEFKKMCREVGFDFYDCYHDMVFSIPQHTNFEPTCYIADWSKKNPYIKPEYQAHVDHIHQAIYNSNCKMVIALGDLALFILVGEKSVAKWRGSQMVTEIDGRRVKVIPTYAPSRILKVWNWRYIAVYDLQRALTESLTVTYTDPKWNFIINPTYVEAVCELRLIVSRLDAEPMLISHDLETIARNISCSGLAWSATDAICIPFMTSEEGRGGNHNYWTIEEETKLLLLHQEILTHPNARVVGQNYLYDMQHIAKSWGFKPNVHMDTMLAWHTVFPGERKSLDFLASIFCDNYLYWKDELKDYNAYPLDLHQYWNYNCKDAVYTYEIAEKLPELLKSAEQEPQYKFQMSMYNPVFHAMLRGVKINLKLRAELILELMEVTSKLEARLMEMSGDFNPEGSSKNVYWFNSPVKCQAFFYDYLGLKKQRNRKTGKISTDDEALSAIEIIEPVVAPLIKNIKELRSANIFRKNFLEAPLGKDGRIRCSYNLAGTETFRLSSSKDAFGQGANLQTIPSGNEED